MKAAYRWLAVASLLMLPGARCGPSVSFSPVFGSGMVLQRAPARAQLQGNVSPPTAAVAVEISGSDGQSYTAQAKVAGGNWSTVLRPFPTGGRFTVTARTAQGGQAKLDNITFGDVFYCAGQSNMALPLAHTFSRNRSIAAIQAGRYRNIRLSGMRSNMNPEQPWAPLVEAVATGGFLQYSSTCYYFAESLTDGLGAEAPPIGIIHTAWGGSTIEQWLENSTVAQCRNTTVQGENQQWHDSRVMPYVGTTIKGWIWYQGENDCNGVMGNSLDQLGYGCLMPKLVANWRRLWSVTPGTTDPQAPFGLVTLAAGTSEGGPDIGGMRWSQTANYGVLPNPLMPNTFMAQGFDLGDPFSDISCYHWQCCWYNYNASACLKATQPVGGPSVCKPYCDSSGATNYYMGPIHARDKKQVGDRLAQAARATVYKAHDQLATGPTVSGCTLSQGKLQVHFNSTLLRGHPVQVRPYNASRVFSGFRVLMNASLFCLQTAVRICGGKPTWMCIYDGQHLNQDCTPASDQMLRGRPPANPFEQPDVWIDVNVTAGDGSSVTLDLSSLEGRKPVAVQYSWQDVQGAQSCCRRQPAPGIECLPGSCPTVAGGLPANPFIARLTGLGKCKCVAPQVCDE